MISYYDERYRNSKDKWLFLKSPFTIKYRSSKDKWSFLKNSSTINFTRDEIKRIFEVEIPNHIPKEQYKKYLYKFLIKNEM